jgi:predicted RNA-binding protein with PUA-like domain
MSEKDVESSVAQHPNIVFPDAEDIWMFQANPQRYDIMNALADDAMNDTIHWLVNQHKADIQKGHIGMIWLSGKEAGIYAITEILTDPARMYEPEPEKRYWIDASDKEGEKTRVKMRIIQRLLDTPITKETILQTKGLENLRILRQPQGTNFRVTPEEWHIIQMLIKRNSI